MTQFLQQGGNVFSYIVSNQFNSVILYRWSAIDGLKHVIN